MKKTKILMSGALCFVLSSCAFWPFNNSSSSTSDEESTSFSFSENQNNEGDYRHAKMKYSYQDYMDNNYFDNMDSMPTSGTVNLLVIPVQLNGTSFPAGTLERLEKAYFGTPEETGWHSVSSYYREESKEMLNITGTISPIYEASYGVSITQDQTEALVTKAANWYKSNHSSKNGKEFDSDGDGYIDGTILIYSTTNNKNNNDNLWAYCFWTSKAANKSSPVANTYFWASYDFMDESKTIPIDAHTYIHELGHVMGLEDYYNYDNNSSYNAAGGFSMQDYNVGEHDPYSRMALGWLNPIVATGNSTLTISPGEAIVLSPNDLQSNSPFDEYLLLDVYSPTGLNEHDSTFQYANKGPKGPLETGIRVWHVNATLMKNYDPDKGKVVLANTIEKGNRYHHAASNSTGSEYGSLDTTWRANKLLQLLQEGGTNTFKNGKYFSESDLWTEGKTFTMENYKSFFVKKGKLDSGASLPYSFSVDSINGSDVTLTITNNGTDQSQK